jgi:hypothetical protein
MRLFRAFILCLTISLSLLSGCEESSLVECVKKWILYNNQNVSVGFDNGAMAIASSSLTNSAPTTFLYQDTVQGDFEMIVEYENLFYNSPGLGFFVSLTGNAINQGNNNYFAAQVGTTLYPGLPQGILQVGAFIDSVGNNPGPSNGNVQDASNSFGELRFRRVGSIVEVISKTGTTNIATYTSNFYTSPIIFGILYGSNYPNTPQYSSSVRIVNFRYYQGATLIDNDSFDCNSLK